MNLRPYVDADEPRARAIYEESFPASLRAPWSEVRDHREDERLLVLDGGSHGPANDGPLGLALLRHLGDTRLTFVRYLAVDSTQRNRGLGGTLVTLLREHLTRDGRSALLLDVEKPAGQHAEDDRRRIAFYRRHGLEVLDVEDYSPPDHGEVGEQVPLLLMGAALNDSGALTGSRAAAWAAAVLRYRYGVISGE